MVTGNGMIAQAFMDLVHDSSVHVFASGVSRSTERDPRAFERERQLICSQPLDRSRFIYFSSCSVYDPSLSATPYVTHKRAMEDLVRERYPDHLIVRLPNLVGHTTNPYTLTNFLRDRILLGDPFDMQVRACRYLLDVEMVSIDLRPLFRLPALKGRAIDVCGSIAFTLPELVRAMELVLGRRTAVNQIDAGSCYTVNNAFFLDLLPESRRSDYERIDLLSLLRKYYSPDRPRTQIGLIQTP
jgi:nucleoside-diphosphate-sugar epimerase